MQGDDLIGRTLSGRYRLRRMLGRGGMGSVYEAEILGTEREAAVKVLDPVPDHGHEVVKRFEREGRAGSLLQHPNVVEVYELGVLEDTRLFLAMELVRGVSVGDLLAATGLGPRRSLVIVRQVLDALAFAHGRGVIHRDLKPDNIMIERVGPPGNQFDRVKLLDFGIAKIVGDAANEFGNEKLTQTGVAFGTPAYMAPEQALGRPIDGRCDLYSLGIVLFEMLTGRKPFESDDVLTVMRMQVSQPAPRLRDVCPGAPHASDAMEALCERALRKAPAERFASAREMRDALDLAFLSIDHVPA